MLTILPFQSIQSSNSNDNVDSDVVIVVSLLSDDDGASKTNNYNNYNLFSAPMSVVRAMSILRCRRAEIPMIAISFGFDFVHYKAHCGVDVAIMMCFLHGDHIYLIGHG